MKKIILLIISIMSILSASKYTCYSEYSWPIGETIKNTVYIDNNVGQIYYYRNRIKTLLKGYKVRRGISRSVYFVDDINDITLNACNIIK